MDAVRCKLLGAWIIPFARNSLAATTGQPEHAEQIKDTGAKAAENGEVEATPAEGSTD